MNKKTKMIVWLFLSAVTITSYFYFPEIMRKVILDQAQKKGIELEFKKAKVGWFSLSLENANVKTRTKSGSFNRIWIKLNNKIKPEFILITGGEIGLKFKESEETKELETKEEIINTKIENVKVNISLGNNKVEFDNSTIEISKEKIKINSTNAKAYSDIGKIELEEVTIEKSKNEHKIHIEKSKVFVKDYEVMMTNTEVNKLKLKNELFEIEMKTDEIKLPRGVLLNGAVLKLNSTLTKEKIDSVFSITLESMSGSHKSISKEVIKTHPISFDGEIRLVSNNDLNVNMKIKSKEVLLGIDMERKNKEIKFIADLSESRCQSVLESIPETMRTELNGVEFEGNMQASVSINIKENEPDVKVKLSHKCKTKNLPNSIKETLSGKQFKRYIYSSKKEIKEITSGQGQNGWTPIELISPYMVKAVITTEDPGFLAHNGFDRGAIENSIKENIKERKFKRGASTIPMQLAKNMFLSRDKTATRKLQEFFLTIIITEKLSRDKILEFYLNLIEFGPDLYGIGPASNHYFDIDPSQLSLSQSIFLASVLPKPRSVYFKPDGSVHESKRNLINLILDLMKRKGMITDEECGAGKEEEVIFGKSNKQSKHEGVEWEMN